MDESKEIMANFASIHEYKWKTGTDIKHCTVVTKLKVPWLLILQTY